MVHLFFTINFKHHVDVSNCTSETRFLFSSPVLIFSQIKARLAKTTKDASSSLNGLVRNQKRVSPVCVVHYDFCLPAKPIAIPSNSLPRPASQSSLDGLNQVCECNFQLFLVMITFYFIYACFGIVILIPNVLLEKLLYGSDPQVFVQCCCKQ
jgi:hypothetical protein